MQRCVVNENDLQARWGLNGAPFIEFWLAERVRLLFSLSIRQAT